MSIGEKAIKIDPMTDRLVDDLAYFLRSTKKSIVRDAVGKFAESCRLPTGSATADGDPVTFETLPVEQRVRLRRDALVRELRRRGASEIRLQPANPTDPTSEPALLVMTEPVMGNGIEVELLEAARTILHVGIDIVSLAKVMRHAPERLQELYLDSEPL